MENSLTPTLYLRLRKRVKIAKGDPIRLGDVAQLITEPEQEQQIRQLLLHSPEEHDGNIILIDMLHIVREVKNHFPYMEIEQYGEPHILVEIISKQDREPHVMVVVFMCFLLFIGSGLAIMNFHEDVSMLEVHQRMYQLVTGKFTEHPYFLQIPYSIGLGAGMVIFFNRLFKKKFNEEPSPLEVEMFLYQENLNHYMISEEYNNLHAKKESR